jgi:DNA repair/transcription protein MET18/MMS19
VPEAIRADTLRDIKPLVLKDLGRALDDPVRIVRREGVECRARWYRL